MSQPAVCVVDCFSGDHCLFQSLVFPNAIYIMLNRDDTDSKGCHVYDQLLDHLKDSHEYAYKIDTNNEFKPIYVKFNHDDQRIVTLRRNLLVWMEVDLDTLSIDHFEIDHKDVEYVAKLFETK